MNVNRILSAIQKGLHEGIRAFRDNTDTFKTTEEMNASIYIDLDSPKDNELYEMANISKAKTGLCCIIWVQTNMPNSTGKHNAPRLKFTDDNRMIPVTISKEPQLLADYSLNDLKMSSKDLNALFFWIKNNYDALMQLWNGEITTDELIDRIKKN